MFRYLPMVKQLKNGNFAEHQSCNPSWQCQFTWLLCITLIEHFTCIFSNNPNELSGMILTTGMNIWTWRPDGNCSFLQFCNNAFEHSTLIIWIKIVWITCLQKCHWNRETLLSSNRLSKTKILYLVKLIVNILWPIYTTVTVCCYGNMVLLFWFIRG